MKKNIYIVGAYYNKDSLKYIACYWKNGTRTDLETMASVANSIFTSGSDIYVAGHYYNGSKTIACYWKNGIKMDLETVYSNATSIFVSGSDVYATGFYNNGIDNIACYWKNGVRVEKMFCEFHSIKLARKKIIIAGSYYDPYYDTSYACQWINGNQNQLSDDLGDAFSIYVDNNDIYIAGYELSERYGDKTVACYWKNGAINYLMPSNLKKDSYAHYITIANGDIFITGQYGRDNIACYWKNGVKMDLLKHACPYDLINIDNTLYIVGYYNNGTEDIACYWIDGIKIDLETVNSYAYSIAITEEDQ